MGFTFCGLKECFVTSGIDRLGTLLGTNLYLWFFINEGGLIMTHPFRQRLEFWEINVTLEGGATASLKTLRPFARKKSAALSFYIVE